VPADQDLYRELILEHYRDPHHCGELTGADVVQPGTHPLCGDDIEVYLKVRGQHVTDIAFKGKGCSISQASASMMTDAVAGKSLTDVHQIAEAFKGMLLGTHSTVPRDVLGDDLEALEGVKKYPVRIKCALLAWNTLLEGLKRIRPPSTDSPQRDRPPGGS